MTEKPSNSVGEIIRYVVRHLEETSDTARLDAEVIMAHHLGVSRSEMLLRHMDQTCPREFVPDIWRRMAHMPVAYITGRQEFFGLPFRVGPGVLIPRADSEVLIEAALELAGEKGKVLDLGTGSGALLLAFLKNRPGWIGVGLDQSADALEMAQANGELLGLARRAGWCQTDWNESDLAAGAELVDLILCNPPYVEDDANLDPDVRDFEPASALFAGPEGLDDYRTLIPQLRKLMNRGAIAIFEIGAGQAEQVTKIAQDHGFSAEIRKDLANRPRCVVLR